MPIQIKYLARFVDRQQLDQHGIQVDFNRGESVKPQIAI